jgi:hypothetical protein
LPVVVVAHTLAVVAVVVVVKLSTVGYLSMVI